ncbi:hypothetical protein QFW77_13910 [Luteimonas sp. RD2P54]|uniref:Uncharacterized protein n=1 Tax=Luteimonas endophytica TaxID=3042023 RepID=A0ABT6JBD7_9GAMM|nr:hypothetical protein [Luteimonas endophytica]MDH5824074.1 hypothetical protein [Luteimonas endophytica]
MPRRHRSTLHQLTALSLVAPGVAATRLLDMATTLGPPTAAQLREHGRMGIEKLAATQEGWFAMGTTLLQIQLRLAGQAMRSAWTPWWPAGGSTAYRPHQALRDADAVLAAGLAPVSRTVAANARRQKRARRG